MSRDRSAVAETLRIRNSFRRSLQMLGVRSRICAAVLIAVSLNACSYIMGSPSLEAVSITPSQDTAWLNNPTPASFEISIAVHNASSHTLFTYWCPIRAERLIDATWQTVFTENCLALRDEVAVPPGRTVIVPFLASASLNAVTPTAKISRRLAPGAYRVIVPLWSEDSPGKAVDIPEAKRRSSTFIVASKTVP